ncbi:MAG: hypothetical protein QXU99_07970 [Candidatus Bathyarchaeia archaeon]
MIVASRGNVFQIRRFTKPDLAKYFDRIEADLKTELSNWHKVRKELQRP